MTGAQRAPRRVLRGVGVVGVAVTLCAGAAVLVAAQSASGGRATTDQGATATTPSTSSPTASPTTSPVTVPAPAHAVVRAVPAAQRPTRIRIPDLGVDATVTELGIGAGGAIEVPARPAQAGWLVTTPAPGQQGPAVIAGHVDSATGPAVFHGLSRLRDGARIEITRRDGTTATFTVDGVRRYPQDRFPTGEVYGPVPGPSLRLITCGGEYDRSRGGYQDNVVVYAS